MAVLTAGLWSGAACWPSGKHRRGFALANLLAALGAGLCWAAGRAAAAGTCPQRPSCRLPADAAAALGGPAPGRGRALSTITAGLTLAIIAGRRPVAPTRASSMVRPLRASEVSRESDSLCRRSAPPAPLAEVVDAHLLRVRQFESGARSNLAWRTSGFYRQRLDLLRASARTSAPRPGEGRIWLLRGGPRGCRHQSASVSICKPYSRNAPGGMFRGWDGGILRNQIG